MLETADKTSLDVFLSPAIIQKKKKRELCYKFINAVFCLDSFLSQYASYSEVLYCIQATCWIYILYVKLLIKDIQSSQLFAVLFDNNTHYTQGKGTYKSCIHTFYLHVLCLLLRSVNQFNAYIPTNPFMCPEIFRGISCFQNPIAS